MNLVVRELRANAKSLLIWSLSLAAFLAMGFVEFSAYYKNPDMLAFLEAIPPAMLEAFGMDEGNLTTVSGYVAVMIPFINLALGIYAVILGNGILAKEERDKTAGFLMTLPVSRPRVITGKLLAAVISCAALVVAVVVSIFASASPYQWEAEFPEFMGLVAVSSLFLKLIFLSLGMLSAALLRRHKLSAALGVGAVIGLYLASILADLSERVSFLKHITPFSYFEGPQMLRTLGLDPLYLAVSAAVIVAAIAATYRAYGRRDLYL